MNGIGYALTERYVFNPQGRMLNTNLDRYRIPTASEAPRIRCKLIPTYEDTGPYGAKSVSEIGINGPLPAIGNAIFNAVGVRMFQSSFTPEAVWAGLRRTGA